MRARAAIVIATLAVASLWGCDRPDAASPRQMRARIEALERERSVLRGRVDELLTRDTRLRQMPGDAVRVGVPTGLVRTLIERVVAGYTDSVVITLSDLRVHKEGTVKRVITIGEYELDVAVDRVTGHLRTGTPEVEFGGNRVTMTLPVLLYRGTGSAMVDFRWDGRNLTDAVCGDMRIRRRVTGRVAPARYRLRGALRLSNTSHQILATPEFPVLRITLRIEPSQASWETVQRLLDEQQGMCGFVLDKVDVRKALEDLIARGFSVKLPTDQLQPIVIPVGIAPSLQIGDEALTLGLEVGQLTITEHMLWLGANVSIAASGARGRPRAPVATAERVARTDGAPTSERPKAHRGGTRGLP